MGILLGKKNRSFGKFLAGKPTRPLAPAACADIVVLRPNPIPFPGLKHKERSF